MDLTVELVGIEGSECESATIKRLRPGTKHFFEDHKTNLGGEALELVAFGLTESKSRHLIQRVQEIKVPVEGWSTLIRSKDLFRAGNTRHGVRHDHQIGGFRVLGCPLLMTG